MEIVSNDVASENKVKAKANAARNNEINKMDEKLRRKSIDLSDKILILDKLKSGARVVALAKELNLRESTVRTIRQNESKIRSMMSNTPTLDLKRVVRIKDFLVFEMEKHLMLWITKCYSRNMLLNTVAIKKRALKVYQQLSKNAKYRQFNSKSKSREPTFKASRGWFERFKKRFSLLNMRLIEIFEKSGGTDEENNLPLNINEGNWISKQIYGIYEFPMYLKIIPFKTPAPKIETTEKSVTQPEDSKIVDRNNINDINETEFIKLNQNMQEAETMDSFLDNDISCDTSSQSLSVDEINRGLKIAKILEKHLLKEDFDDEMDDSLSGNFESGNDLENDLSFLNDDDTLDFSDDFFDMLSTRRFGWNLFAKMFDCK